MFLSGGLEDPDMQCLVYDIGSYMMCIGFSGDDAPRSVFPSVVGRPINPPKMVGWDSKDCYVGDEALAERRRKLLKYNRPIKSDRNHFDYGDLEKIFHHCPYNELCLTPEEHPHLLTSLHFMDEVNLRRLTEMMFETFNVPALYFADSGVLSLYSGGRVTGTSVELGHGITQCCCVYSEFPIHHSKFILDDHLNHFGSSVQKKKRIGGDLMTDLFIQFSQHHFSPISEKIRQRDSARMLKEKFCYLTLPNDFKNELEPVAISELPDGLKLNTTIEIKDFERKRTPEILFDPSICGFNNLPGLHELIKYSIDHCDEEFQDKMFKNIVLSGSCSSIKNLEERLKFELEKIESKRDVEIFGSCETRELPYYNGNFDFSAWTGGSILSSLSSFENKWVNKDEYENYGWKIMERKCMQFARVNKKKAVLFRKTAKDVDFVERMEYALHECYNEDINFSFRIVIFQSSCVLKIRFKSIMLL